MPADPLQHIKPGDPIRASMLNAVIDGAKIARNLSESGGKDLKTSASNILVRILNDTGEDLDRFAVVALTEPLFEPDDIGTFFQEPAFRGSIPNESTTGFAILQQPAQQGQIVSGCVAGVSVVKLNVESEDSEFAVCDGVTKMSAASEGVARILWKESGTGEKWGLVLYPVGGAGASKTYAVVMSAIQCPNDPTADPDNEDFRDKMGEIKIEGKMYDKDNPVYDKCACRELAGKDDEHPEQLIKGTQIEVIKTGQYDNPDYVAPDPEADPPVEGTPNEPQKLDWYIAVETEGIYQGKLTSQITGSDPDVETSTSTIKVKDSDDEEVTLTVHSTALGSSQNIETDTGIIATRINGQLVITKARCPT